MLLHVLSRAYRKRGSQLMALRARQKMSASAAAAGASLESACQWKQHVVAQTRLVGMEAGRPQVLLEACVENATKGTLFLEYVRFDPTPGMTAVRVAPSRPEPIWSGPHASRGGKALAAYTQGLQVRHASTFSGRHSQQYKGYPLSFCTPELLPCAGKFWQQ